MNEPSPDNSQTADPSRTTRYPPGDYKTCFYCMRPRPGGTAMLGGPAGQGGTPIPVCAAGVGCRDGRIYHGPPHGTSHWPADPCEVCPPERDNRIRDNRGRPALGGRGINQHHTGWTR